MVWNWREREYDPTSGRIVSSADENILLPYSYVVFGVSCYEED
jgi:hypothetical protein